MSRKATFTYATPGVSRAPLFGDVYRVLWAHDPKSDDGRRWMYLGTKPGWTGDRLQLLNLDAGILTTWEHLGGFERVEE